LVWGARMDLLSFGLSRGLLVDQPRTCQPSMMLLYKTLHHNTSGRRSPPVWHFANRGRGTAVVEKSQTLDLYQVISSLRTCRFYYVMFSAGMKGRRWVRSEHLTDKKQEFTYPYPNIDWDELHPFSQEEQIYRLRKGKKESSQGLGGCGVGSYNKQSCMRPTPGAAAVHSPERRAAMSCLLCGSCWGQGDPEKGRMGMPPWGRLPPLCLCGLFSCRETIVWHQRASRARLAFCGWGMCSTNLLVWT